MSSKAKASARVSRMRSCGPPSDSITVMRLAPMPRAVSSSATARGVVSSQDSARMRACGCRCGTIRNSVRPCSETSAHSSCGQRIRVQAIEKEEDCGMIRISAAGMARLRLLPMP